MEGVSNKEELEKVVEEEIKAQKEREADNKFIEDLLEKASKNMKVEIDEEIIDAETDRMYKNLLKNLRCKELLKNYILLTLVLKKKIS